MSNREILQKASYFNLLGAVGLLLDELPPLDKLDWLDQESKDELYEIELQLSVLYERAEREVAKIEQFDK